MSAVWNRLRKGLHRTRRTLWAPLEETLKGGGHVDEEALDRLEEMLLTADVGLEATDELLAPLREHNSLDAAELAQLLHNKVAELLAPAEGNPAPAPDGAGPAVYVFVGVNGSGKTTTVAKVGRALASHGTSVVLAAADTFRAAAVEQLTNLAQRTGLELVSHRPGADPGAVVHDAVEHARIQGYDVVLVDTAGRLQTKRPLMEELGKVRRVVERLQGRPPDERILVVDASVGQNAVSQAELFDQAVGLTSLVLTKLDGTAKGGAILPIWQTLRIPILWVGVGEGMDELERFSAGGYAGALIGGEHG
ncbi:MAG: signal recognition particle-docking protein FtsY [Candidatus Bipolaricaulota bacterium]